MRKFFIGQGRAEVFFGQFLQILHHFRKFGCKTDIVPPPGLDGAAGLQPHGRDAAGVILHDAGGTGPGAAAHHQGTLLLYLFLSLSLSLALSLSRSVSLSL